MWRRFWTYTEFASAERLVVEILFPDDGIPALLQSAFPPVFPPPGYAGEERTGVPARFVDLGEIFPSGRGKGRRQGIESVFGGVFRSPDEPEPEALQASFSPFGFLFQAFGNASPRCMVIGVFNDFQTAFASVTDAFVQPFPILLIGDDIAVGVENDGAESLMDQVFNDGSGARSATGVEKDFVHFRQR